MADLFTANLSLRMPEVGAAADSWGGPAGLNGDMELIDAVFLATGLGTSVGLHVGAAKTLNVEGSMQIADSTDTTKRAVLLASQIATATTHTYSFPDASGTLALAVVGPAAGTVYLHSEVVLAAPATQLAVSFPAAAKVVDLVWDVAMTPASDVLIAIQGMVGEAPVTTAGYTFNRLHSSGTSGATSVTGDLNNSLTAFNLQSPNIFRGKVTFTTPSKGLGVGQVYGVSTAGVRTFSQIGLEAQGIIGLDGYRLFCASNNFAIGSFLRCFVVT